MTIAELDGYVAALIVCPEVVLPSEWLPGVWGGEHEFADVAEAEATIAAVMGHYNRITRELAEHLEDYAWSDPLKVVQICLRAPRKMPR